MALDPNSKVDLAVVFFALIGFIVVVSWIGHCRARDRVQEEREEQLTEEWSFDRPKARSGERGRAPEVSA